MKHCGFNCKYYKVLRNGKHTCLKGLQKELEAWWLDNGHLDSDEAENIDCYEEHDIFKKYDFYRKNK